MKAIRVRAFETCVVLLALGAPAQTWAQATGGRSIYTCVTAAGKTLTSDRLIAECSGREQRILNADGSLNRVVPPALTADERAVVEERERAATAARTAKLEAARRDRSLLTRYPDEAAHARARAAAIDSVNKLLRASEGRLVELAKERKPLTADAEFYAGKPLPPQLKAQLDANDVSTEGQRYQIASQKAELDRINKNFDAELQRMKKLWAGAPPGSLEPQVGAVAATK
jgi:hypothetical protein